jgi:hypothetical protein
MTLIYGAYDGKERTTAKCGRASHDAHRITPPAKPVGFPICADETVAKMGAHTLRKQRDEPTERIVLDMIKISVCAGLVVVTGLMWCGSGSPVSAAERDGGLSADGQPGLSSLTSSQASGGLKEALSMGVSTAVAETGKPGGYENNPLIKIVMPQKLQTVEKGLRAVGMGAQVDGFEHSMNAAAEQAAPAAKAIFMDALKAMTFEDAKQIVAGGNTAGTEYFKRTTSTKVSDAFRPIIEKAMANTGVTEKYDSLMGSAPKLPFEKAPSLDINAYVLQKSVDGLFTMMGQEEAKIRTNPAAQVTPLLKTVFGKF